MILGWMDRGGSNQGRTDGPGVHGEGGSKHPTTPGSTTIIIEF